MSVVTNWQLCKRKNSNKLFTPRKNIIGVIFFGFLRKSVSILLFLFLIAILIIGMGLVYNAEKQANNNPFFNFLYFDSNNYILWFRYFGLSAKINLDFTVLLYNFQKFVKIMYTMFLILLNKLLILLSNVF